MNKKAVETAVRIARRWISEERYKWLIYHTNITHFGLIRLSAVTGNPEFRQHVEDAYRYYSKEKTEELFSPDYHMHTFGIAEAELYMETKASWVKEIICRHAEDLIHKQRRAPDGSFTFRDKDVIFVDCLAGIIPFLARMGSISGEDRYFDEAVRQIRNFHDRLRDPATGLICQGEGFRIFDDWPDSERRRTEGAWGRGNGWMALAFAELIAFLPERHRSYQDVMDRLTEFFKVLARYQDSGGMWRQVINRPDAYPETTGTALISYSFARLAALKKAGLEFLEPAVRGRNALLDMVDTKTDIHGVCIGTPFQVSEEAYFNLPAPVNDLHGHGVLIMAFTENYND